MANRLYVRARELRVDLGRWISRDLIGLRSNAHNLYRFVRNNPVAHTNPKGPQQSSTVTINVLKTGSKQMGDCLIEGWIEQDPVFLFSSDRFCGSIVQQLKLDYWITYCDGGFAPPPPGWPASGSTWYEGCSFLTGGGVRTVGPDTRILTTQPNPLGTQGYARISFLTSFIVDYDVIEKVFGGPWVRTPYPEEQISKPLPIMANAPKGFNPTIKGHLSISWSCCPCDKAMFITSEAKIAPLQTQANISGNIPNLNDFFCKSEVK